MSDDQCPYFHLLSLACCLTTFTVLQVTWAKLSEVAVKGAQYNSRERQPHPKCLQGTRVDLLKYIHGFLDDTEKNQLIWLHGTAGVGKSAVAFTVADKMRSLKVREETNIEKRLAGTFFFSRKHTKRCTTGYFFVTLVYQLATNFPSIRKDVNRTIHDNPALLDPDTPLCDQMEALFLQPLRWLQLRLRGCPPLSFIVDALDECSSEPELTDLILSLAQALQRRGAPVSALDTGEGGIISLDGADVDHDICTFLRHSFVELGSRHADFPQPSEADVEKLASRAGRRFIVASTMMKFIIDDEDNDPRDRLQLMLKLTSELLPGTEVYKLYDRILSTCIDSKRAYMHLSIVAALTDPLPLSQISKLLGPGLGRDVQTTLMQLRSVLDIPTDTSLPVNIHHSSVRDYVSDPSNCGLPQVCDTASPHSLLAYSSLRLLKAIPESTALLDALSKLNKHNHAMKPEDPRRLKNSLAFLVRAPEPVSVLISMLWLRGERNADMQSWLQTQAGRDWLQTQAGEDWLRTQGARDWLQTQVARDWLQTRAGENWLKTREAQDWLQTRGARDWLQTQGARDWLQTRGARDWLQTQGARDWLQWLKTQAGRDWLQTQAGEDWLRTRGARDWLQTWAGEDWLRTRGARDWLKTRGAQDWLQTRGGGNWLKTQGGEDWLQTMGGRGWLWTLQKNWRPTQEKQDWRWTQGRLLWPQTQAARDWLQTQRGRDWLQAQEGRDWLHTDGGQYWLQTHEARDWLQTRGARDWLQTRGARDWLQTRGARDWLQTQVGEDWLQTLGGRDWLQTPCGRDWLQTPHGRDWLQTPHGQVWQSTPAASVWVTMEEFLKTLEAINDYIVISDVPLLPAFQVIQQVKALPDFLMFPVFLAFRHQHHSTSASPESLILPDRDIIHAVHAFESFANAAQERSQSAPDALKYACHNWVVHLSRAPHPWDGTLNCIFQAFCNDYIIPWLEMEWCLKGLRSCLVILSEGQKIVKSMT
ncbi:hypothetical protein EDD22DRAFT_966014 [Suillus occidentalis]|nr:hypothetical protein EDD22DRAFT_966014 [Suillus occidentalis]